VSTAWAIALLVGALLCSLSIAIANSLLAGEVRAWLPHLARHLVRAAVRRLPADCQARYETDWLAELIAWEDRPMSALAKAAHIRWKVRAIRESLGGVEVKSEGAKRVLDLLIASGTLLILSPCLLAIAIAIKLDSRGPVFFGQPRAGRGDRRFRLIKFRSMYLDAGSRMPEPGKELQEAGVRFTIHRDPRITRVGRFIRRSSLDELPQLINVIKGDMSLVGPRPLIPREAAELKEGQKSSRSTVRPGITGLWHFGSPGRRPYTFRDLIRLDEQYLRSRSLLLDLQLLLASLTVFFRRR
jgi:lipopolysaccharide/colanic/teichoic acid biosynthesis glycosyltransferase